MVGKDRQGHNRQQFRKYRPDRYSYVLVLYLKRPRAKSWELRRCVGALQIQRLEGSRPGGTMGFVSG